MNLLILLSASTKIDALIDALKLRRLLISILCNKCIKCINILVNTLSLCIARDGWSFLMHLMHLKPMHIDFSEYLMHF